MPLAVAERMECSSSEEMCLWGTGRGGEHNKGDD